GRTRPQGDGAPEERGQACRGTRIVRGHGGAVGQGDLDRRHRLALGLSQVARAAQHELGELLAAADLARGLVPDRPAAVAKETRRAECRPLEMLTAHRLHGIAPQLADRADDRHARRLPSIPPRWRGRPGDATAAMWRSSSMPTWTPSTLRWSSAIARSCAGDPSS